MHDGVTDSEFNVKPFFQISFSPRLRRDIVAPVAGDNVWAMAIDWHGQD